MCETTPTVESFFCSDLLRTESHSSQLIAGVARAVLQASQCMQCTETCMYILWYVSIHHVPHPLRSEQVSLLHKLRHPHIIASIGVVLQPLCFILAWACGGALHAILIK